MTKQKIENTKDMIKAAKILLRLGAKNVLLKGGHGKSDFTNDVFLSKNEKKIFKNRRIKTKNTHGTGCTLSSAIATFISCGKPLKKSCELGIKYVNHAIEIKSKLWKRTWPSESFKFNCFKKNFYNEKHSSSRFTMGR